MTKSIKLVCIVVALVIAVTSATFVTAKYASVSGHEGTIAYLDEKKDDVVKITAGSAVVATTLALVPVKATDPLANKILDLTGYGVIIMSAIFLEKYLLTTICYVAFRIIIPIACLLFIAAVLLSKGDLLKFSCKLAVAALIFAMIIPGGAMLGKSVDATYKDVISTSIDTAEAVSSGEEINVDKEDKGFIAKIKSGIEEASDAVTGKISQGKTALSRMTEGIAVMIVTSCIIPILVVILALWSIRILFGLNFGIPRVGKLSNAMRRSRKSDESESNQE